MKPRYALLFTLLGIAIVALLVVDLMVGSADIGVADVVRALTGGDVPRPVHRVVVDIRLVKALVAMLAGMALAVSGLQMQTLFSNPLAGPYVLGVSAGASLMAAVFVLAVPMGVVSGLAGSSIGMAAMAWIGSAVVLALMSIVASRIKDIMVILILGMMISSGISAVVEILQYLSSEDALKTFVVWTMGSLGNVTSAQLPVIAAAILLGMVLAVATVKPLNLLLLGEDYATTMGLNIRRSRVLIFASTTLLAGTVTAFCGPIGFIGLAMPHIARGIFGTSDHRILIPASALTGVVVMLLCDIVSKKLLLPINAVTSLTGIPVVVWIVLKNKNLMSR